MDTLTFDVTDMPPALVAELLSYAERLRNGLDEGDETGTGDDESWRSAPFDGWTIEHVELLRQYLVERGDSARLKCFDLAIEQGGWISREQVYSVCDYDASRRLTGWTRPFDTAANLLEWEHELPEDASWPVWADYAEGDRWKQARGFKVSPGIVRLVREHEEAAA